MRIDGKHVIVTGASSGIGRALAVSLAARGAALTVAARREDELKKLAGEIVERFPSAPRPVVVRCDVASPADVSWLIGGAIERLGVVDALINNAGVSVYGGAERTRAEDLSAVMSVNFFGAMNCMREVLPFMTRRESGLIVNVASVAALFGVPYLSAYCASKAALVAASQSLRAELAGSGVRIMIVYPGYTATEIFERETNVGGARRPSGSYAPANQVAEAIVRGIERDARDLVLTSRGRALYVLRGIAPSVVERALTKLARELRDKEEPSGDRGRAAPARKGAER